jgi:hypothetical protein
MAAPNKLTLRVQPNRRNQVVTVTTTGFFGQLSVGTTKLYLPNQVLITAATSDAYWVANINAILAALAVA